MEEPGKIVVGNGRLGIGLERSHVVGCCLLRLALFCQRDTESDMGLLLDGFEPNGFLVFGDGFVELALLIKRMSEIKMSFGKTGRVAQSRAVVLNSLIVLAF